MLRTLPAGVNHTTTMDEELTIESLAAEISAAEQAEQPQIEDSATEGEQIAAEEGAQDEAQEVTGEESAGDGQDGHPPADPTTEDPIIEWTTASGEAFKVPRSELQKGYLRQADYTQKAQSLAEERKQAQAVIQQQVEEVQALGAEYGALQAATQRVQAYQQLDWAALRAHSQEQYNTARLELHDAIEQQRQAGAALEEKRQAWQQQTNATKAQRLQAAAQYLSTKVPGFSDGWLVSLRDQAMKAGYTLEELSAIDNGRLVEDIWKARQWDALQAKKPEVQNKLKAVPPASARKPAQQVAPTTRQEQAVKVLNSKKSFTTDEFARLYATLK